MRYIFVLLVASVLSILAFKYANNSLGGGELMASPMDVTQAPATTLADQRISRAADRARSGIAACRVRMPTRPVPRPPSCDSFDRPFNAKTAQQLAAIVVTRKEAVQIGADDAAIS